MKLNRLPGSKRARQQKLLQEPGASSKRQRFGPCPVCNRSFSLYFLEDHVNKCLDSSLSDSPSTRTASGSRPASGSVDSSYPRSPSGGTNKKFSLTPSGISSPASSTLPPSTDSDDAISESDRSRFVNSSASGACLDQKVRSLLLEGALSSRFQSPSSSADRCLSLEAYRGHLGPDAVGDEARQLRSLVEGKSQAGVGTGFSAQPPCRSPGSRVTEMSGAREAEDGVFKEKKLGAKMRDGGGETLDRPPAGFTLFQKQVQSQARLSMFGGFFSSPSLQRKPTVTVLQPGMVLFRSWLELETQQKLVQESQAAAHLFHRPTTSGGGKYHIYSMCLGAKRDTKAYRHVSKGREELLPVWMFELAQKLAWAGQQHTAVYPLDSVYAPDVCLVNFYPVKADELGVVGIGGHQDLDANSLMPVVSVSVGDSMTFFYRRLPPLSRRKSGVLVSVDEEAARCCADGDAAHNREHQILLESGDVLIFGGESRMVYHGTRHVLSGTRPPGLHMVPGRLNFTFRQTD